MPTTFQAALQAAFARGQAEAALAELRRMVEEDPDNPYAINALAMVTASPTNTPKPAPAP